MLSDPLAQTDRLASRRLQLVRLDPLWLRLYLTGEAPTLRHSLPADTTVLWVYSDHPGLFLYAVVHSAEFPVVPENEVPPIWSGQLRTGDRSHAE